MMLDTLKYMYLLQISSEYCRNDFDAIPRSVSTTGLDDHNGSRNRLMFMRREVARVYGDSKMEIAVNLIPKINTKRSNLITNASVENN